MTVSPCRLDLLQSASNMPTTLGWYGITKGKKKDGLLEGDDSHSPTDHFKDENPMVKIWSTVEIYELNENREDWADKKPVEKVGESTW